MDRDLSPFCFTSDGTSIYAAAYDHEWEGTTSTSQKRRIAKIIVVQSNQYPSSLDTLTWSLVAVASIPSLQPTPKPNTLAHTCTIDPKTARFGISAQAPNGSITGSTGFNMEVSTILPSDPLVSLSKPLYGQGLLLPHDDSENPWLRIHLNQRDNKLILVSLDKQLRDRPDPPHWNITGTRGGLIAHLNNTLYILQPTGMGPLLSTIFLDPTTPPPSVMPSVTQTANTTLDEDCDLNDDQTAMVTDKRTLYLVCWERAQHGLPGLQMFKVYTLNGTVFQQLTAFPAETIHTMQEQDQQGRNASLQMVPVPNQNGSASWIYLYHPNGHAYSIDPLGNNSGYLSKSTTVRVTQRLSEYTWPSEGKEDTMGGPLGKAFLYLAFAGILFLLCLCAIRHHTQKPKKPRRLTPEHHPTTIIPMQPAPMPDYVPTTYRVPSGEDACDTLPHYTPRYTDPLPKYTEPSSSSSAFAVNLVPPPTAVVALGNITGALGSARVS